VRPGVDADFLAALLTTPFFIGLVRLHRSGGVKQRLYVQDLLDIGIPRLELSVQRAVGAARRVAEDRFKRATASHRKVRQEVEDVIIGLRPLPA
jgi:hypothetical protein